MLIEIPDIPLIHQTVSDRLTGINNAAAAYRQKKIDLFSPAKLDPFIYKRKSRIGHHAAQLHIRNSLALQRSPDLRKQARTLGAAAAVMDQNPATARFFHKPAGLLPGIFTEDYFRWCMISKLEHKFYLLSFL